MKKNIQSSLVTKVLCKGRNFRCRISCSPVGSELSESGEGEGV